MPNNVITFFHVFIFIILVILLFFFSTLSVDTYFHMLIPLNSFFLGWNSRISFIAARASSLSPFHSRASWMEDLTNDHLESSFLLLPIGVSVHEPSCKPLCPSSGIPKTLIVCGIRNKSSYLKAFQDPDYCLHTGTHHACRISLLLLFLKASARLMK